MQRRYIGMIGESEVLGNITKGLKFILEGHGSDVDEPVENIEVAIPEWAATYIEYGDDSAIREHPEDMRMVDDYLDKIARDGFRLVYDGEELGFCSRPEFGLGADCIKYYLVPIDDNKVVTEDGEQAPTGDEPAQDAQSTDDQTTQDGAGQTTDGDTTQDAATQDAQPSDDEVANTPPTQVNELKECEKPRKPLLRQS